MLDILKEQGVKVEQYAISGEKIQLTLRLKLRHYQDSLRKLVASLEGFKIEDLY